VALVIAELVKTFATVGRQNEEERKRIRMWVLKLSVYLKVSLS